MLSQRVIRTASSAKANSLASCIASKRYVTIGSMSKLDNLDAKKQQFVEPRLGYLRAYDEALKLLQLEQNRLKSEITQLEAVPEKASLLKRKKIQLGYTVLENHWKFNSGSVDFATLDPASEYAETLEAMKAKRFNTVVVPKLVKLAEFYQIYVDAFPGKTAQLMKPKVNVEVDFQNTNWEACYGQPVPPNWALYSPKVTINTHSSKPGKYTLVLMDLDRPSLSSNSIQEWCHWLITDIPVTNRLTIAPGTSPYLGASTIETSGLTGTSFHPSQPSEPAVLPGTVVLPYIPPHPANSNPRKNHRYLLTVFEQEGETPVNVKLESIREEALKLRQGELEKKPWEKDFLGEKEESMNFIERGGFSTWGLGSKYGLTVAGYAFFTSQWNLHTPDIFTRLGIHEPVYGDFPKNPMDTVHRMEQATLTTKSALLGDKLLSSLTLKEIQQLNSGKTPLVPKFKIPTRASIKAEELRAKHLARLSAPKAPAKGAAATAAKAKGGKKVVPGTKVPTPSVVRVNKLPRLNTVGSVAVVRAKENDVASTAVGDVTKSVFQKRGRYHNV
ncbi:phosphatidylethanolamine-binding protein [Obelidium mucronatum]|nr:phosphatidylethanolamine-binding protein [Obelidium mucronatum]